MKTLDLVEVVRAARETLCEAGAPDPEVLFLLGTGARAVATSLASRRTLPLASVSALPAEWRAQELHTGLLGGARVWMLEDAPALAADTPRWVRALPCWLAAAAGASLCVHTSAGIALHDAQSPPGLEVGSLALVKDHINLSGQTPLEGVGETPLGPLFPDQTRLHHAGLRERVASRARERGIQVGEAVVACTLGPSLSTPAELRWYEATGATVAVQDLAGPLIASAHAGLSMLALVALTDSGRAPLRLQQIIERAEACAPALEDLLVASAEDFATVARELAGEA